ncbi:MAG TPA: FAD-binding oxidoreductase [Bacteroidales bacterium]|jgi:glycine/D-amino acid oxidase-like deaminating enzyme|nr:FAD-binding oxidoreductase [Bacteroidales bacterium]
MKRDGKLESIWQSEIKHYGQEQTGVTSNKDVVIVGAGITGITCALMLQKKGMNCILIEANNMGFGTTGGTTAHLNTFFDTPYYQVIKDFGLESAKLLAYGAMEVHDIIKEGIEKASGGVR